MKYVVLALILASAGAGADPACVPAIPCGTYEGKGSWFSMKGKPEGGGFEERLIITPVDEKTVLVEEFVFHKGEKPDDAYHVKAKFVFSDDAQYTAYLEKTGEAFANGACRNGVCTFAFFPWANADKTVAGNVNTLRFENGKLRRLLLFSRDLSGKYDAYSKSDLVKK